MRRHVFNNQTDKLIRIDDAQPICGKDFCDRCGDCLSCFEGDCCWNGHKCEDEHYWVVYENTESSLFAE